MPMAPDTQSSTATIDELEQAPAQKLVRGDSELPLLPQVASQVMALTTNAATDTAKLSSLTHQYHALAAHVLRIANSPASIPRSRVVSLQHAVALRGINLLSKIASTACGEERRVSGPGA